MDDGSTKLLNREEAAAKIQASNEPGFWRARWLLLITLLAVGALVSYVVVSQRSASPGAEDPMKAEAAAQQAQQGRDAASRPDSDGDASGHAMQSMKGAEKIKAVTPDTVEKEWGVRVTRLSLIADGGFVDLRYRVTDPGKASGVMDEDQPVFLLDEESGKSVTTAQLPKLGDLRQSFEKGDSPERVYFMGFGNPTGLFETGDEVTLAIGPNHLEHLTIR